MDFIFSHKLDLVYDYARIQYNGDMGVLNDVTGKQFGRLTITKCLTNGHRDTFWECICSCGTKKTINARNIVFYGTRSCGCLKVESLIKRTRTHGFSANGQTREYRAWACAKTRCYNKKDHAYPRYGGRGISMCRQWKNDPAEFVRDMGPCPPKHRIDRIDFNGNYEPKNCRWVDTKTSGRNKSSSIIFEWKGAQRCISEIAEMENISHNSLRARHKRGQSIHDSVEALKR